MKNNMDGHFVMQIPVNFIKVLADVVAAKVSASRSAQASGKPIVAST